MKKLGKGENATRSFTVDGSLVHVSATIAAERDGDRYQMEVDLSFEECIEEEILLLAAKTAWIKYQADWRKAREASRLDAATWERQVDVKTEIIDAERKTADALTKAKSLVGKMTADERAALKALLG